MNRIVLFITIAMLPGLVSADVTKIVGFASISDGRKTVTSAGTAEAISASSDVCQELTIVAETDNTGVMAVGGSTVVASLSTRRGVPLSSGDAVTLKLSDIKNVYVDSTVSGDGVTWLCLE